MSQYHMMSENVSRLEIHELPVIGKDLKLIIAFEADKFDKLAEANLEEGFLAGLKDIDGLDTIETQTVTLMPM